MQYCPNCKRPNPDTREEYPVGPSGEPERRCVHCGVSRPRQFWVRTTAKIKRQQKKKASEPKRPGGRPPKKDREKKPGRPGGRPPKKDREKKPGRPGGRPPKKDREKKPGRPGGRPPKKKEEKVSEPKRPRGRPPKREMREPRLPKGTIPKMDRSGKPITLTAGRRKVLDHITEHPGHNYSAVRSAVGLPTSSFHNHVEYLLEKELIESRTVGIYKLFYPKGGVDDGGPVLGPREREMLRVLEERGPIYSREFVKYMDVSVPTVMRLLNGLAGKGLIERERMGRKTLVSIVKK